MKCAACGYDTTENPVKEPFKEIHSTHDFKDWLECSIYIYLCPECGTLKGE